MKRIFGGCGGFEDKNEKKMGGAIPNGELKKQIIWRLMIRVEEKVRSNGAGIR